MKLAIMQPYFLPYIGYWQLINAVDKFVIYDNIQYTKKGWINRNRLLQNGSDILFTIPLQKDSDYLNVIERYIAADFNKAKFLNRIRGAYSKAPNFKTVFQLIELIINYEESNLFKYIKNSILEICGYLELKTDIIDSSSIKINHELKGQDKVIAICEKLGATTYINPEGGVQLYGKSEFLSNSIDLQFLKSENRKYMQFDNEFIPFLSIIDVLMFNDKDSVKEFLSLYTII